MRTTLLMISALLAAAAPALAQNVAVRGGVVYTMAGAPIENGVVVVRDGKIAQVGPAASIAIPEGFEVLDAAIVLPGLVDAHSVVGLAGQFNVPHDQDQLERSASVQPELRAIDAFNIRERLVVHLRELGITTVHTGHGPGAVVSGQTMVVKTAGPNADVAVLRAPAMVAATLGESALRDGGKSPGTRSKSVALLRQALLEAQAHRAKGQQADRDLGKETLVAVLEGELPLLVTAHRHQDIVSALRLAEEFGFDLVLDGAADAHLVLDTIAAAKVPVIVHPTMARTGSTQGGSETENATMGLAAKLHEAGIAFAFQSGYESYVPKTRVVLFEAGLATAYGLDREAALRAITIDAARLIGVGDRVGSLEPGKDGDLALYDGDPFEYTAHCVGVVIDGTVVSREVR